MFEAVNAKLAGRASELGFSHPIPFLCECQNPRCFALVRLPAAEYAERRANGRPITIATHSPRPVGISRRDGKWRA